MRLQLSDEIHRNLNHDKQGRAAQNERNRQSGNQDFRQDAQSCQIDRAKHRQTGNHIVQILCRIFARTDTGNKTAVLFRLSAVSSGLNTTAV